jgi:AraC-like DNA-binding protein
MPELVHAAPSPALAGRVTSYWGYREHSVAPFRRRELPSGEVTLIVSLGPTLEVGGPGAGGATHRVGSFITGLSTGPALTAFAGEQHGIEVNLTPLAARMLVGDSMAALADRVVPLDAVLGREADLLAERLHGEPEWGPRFALLDAALARRLAAAADPAPDAAWAWRRLRETHGRLPIGALVREIGCSHRHLGTQLREHVGLAPKTAARVLRFDRAVTLMRADAARWADIAADCGYYDQAHLNRDFRDLAGTTPGELLAARVPDGAGIAA